MPPSSRFISSDSVKESGTFTMYYKLTLKDLSHLVELLNSIRFEGGECITEEPRIKVIREFKDSLAILLGDSIRINDAEDVMISNSVEDVVENVIKPKLKIVSEQMGRKSVKGLLVEDIFKIINKFEIDLAVSDPIPNQLLAPSGSSASSTGSNNSIDINVNIGINSPQSESERYFEFQCANNLESILMEFKDGSDRHLILESNLNQLNLSIIGDSQSSFDNFKQSLTAGDTKCRFGVYKYQFSQGHTSKYMKREMVILFLWCPENGLDKESFHKSIHKIKSLAKADGYVQIDDENHLTLDTIKDKFDV